MTRRAIYLAGFLVALSTAFPAYLNSSFLARIVGEDKVGLIYSASAALALVIFWFLPRAVARRGARFWFLVFNFIGFSATFLLASKYFGAPVANLILFGSYYLSTIFASFCLDILLERLTRDRVTGEIRGIYFTSINFAWIITPLLAGIVVDKMGFEIAYLVVAIIYLAILALANTWQKAKVNETHDLKMSRAKLWRATKSLKHILTIEFLLNFFYSVMVIYMPIYLRQNFDFSLTQVGIIFTIMLLPFVLTEYPLGRLADRSLGEKEILIAGISILSLATAFTSFMTSHSIIAWAILLFATRLGAASIEIMKETYLFKKINASEVEVLAISRNLMPLGHLAGAFFSFLYLLYFPLQYIFLVVALIYFVIGLPHALALRDTK